MRGDHDLVAILQRDPRRQSLPFHLLSRRPTSIQTAMWTNSTLHCGGPASEIQAMAPSRNATRTEITTPMAPTFLLGSANLAAARRLFQATASA